MSTTSSDINDVLDDVNARVTEIIAERNKLRAALREVGTRLHGLQLHATAGGINVFDLASDLRGIRDDILRILNEQPPANTTTTGRG